jgi:predicted unusual protein kinase regulating ubiquinone biosynthesis (AarF/ABC1/UbiB family)
MRPVLEQDLGRTAEEAFAEFDTTPIAAASIGQVYRARTHDDREVAVKVQYAGIAAAVRADLKNLALLLKFAKPVFPSLDGKAMAEEIRLHIDEELDYLHEARVQRELARRYARHPAILVPDALTELCGPRVLVSEFVNGRRMHDVCQLPIPVRDRVGELIYRFYIGSTYLDYQFNGDPHPGNVLLAEDDRVAFLDFGLFKRMAPAAVEIERQALRAAIEERAEDLRDALEQTGGLRPETTLSSAEILAYTYDASPWTFADEPLTITPQLASGAFMVLADPRAEDFERLRRETLPAEHFFSRRADFYTAGILGQLRATANWHRIAREWICGDEPATELGALDAQWRNSRLST